MSEVAPLISDLAIILIIAGIVTVIFKWLKQPVILGYIVAGIMAGPSVSLVPTVSDPANIKIWADIGVIFLLFAMGLDFSFKKLINVGITAIVATVTIVCGMMFIGYTAGNAMGFSHMSSIFLGGMLSMSSTAIVFKAFNDMGLLQQKFTGIVLGILVIEDLVAVVMMVVLSTLAVGKHFEGKEMLESILKLAAFLIFWSALGIYLIPTLLKKIRRFTSNEILLITSLGLCLGMVMIATKAGFSAALGAFVMGSLLAETVEAEKIVHIVQPVKDLFASIFFVSVGMMIDPAMMWEYAVPILILTLLVLSGQVLFGSFGVLLSGQPLKIAIQSGFSLTQVGEFAFIIASLGVSLNVTDKYLYPVIVAVSVITTFLTPYMIRLSEPAYRFIDIHMPESLKDYLVHYTSGAMTVKHQGTWHKLIRSMLVSVTLYLVVCVFFITLYFSYVHPLIRKSLPGMEGNLLGFIIIFLVISPFLWAIIMKRNNSTEFTLIVLLHPGAIFPACGLVFWKNSSILEAISRGILCCPGQQGAAVLQRTSRWGEGVDPYENRIDHGRRCHAGHVHGGRAGRSDGERPCDRRCDRRVGRRGVWLQLQITPDRPRHPLQHRVLQR